MTCCLSEAGLELYSASKDFGDCLTRKTGNGLLKVAWRSAERLLLVGHKPLKVLITWYPFLFVYLGTTGRCPDSWRHAGFQCTIILGTFRAYLPFCLFWMLPDLINNLNSSGLLLYKCSTNYSTLKHNFVSRILTTTTGSDTLHCTMVISLKGICLGSNYRFFHYLWCRLPDIHCWKSRAQLHLPLSKTPLSAPSPPKFPEILCHSLACPHKSTCHVFEAESGPCIIGNTCRHVHRHSWSQPAAVSLPIHDDSGILHLASWHLSSARAGANLLSRA